MTSHYACIPGVPQSRIHYGTATNTGTYKFMAHLEARQLLVLWSGICGAVITDNRYVITAAHCVEGRRNTDLRIVINKGLSNEARVNVETITMHEGYGSSAFPGAYPNDVAVLRLAVNSVIGSGHPISLAKPEDGDRSGQTCSIMGWGLTESGSASSVLLETDGKILSSSQCAGYWSTNYNHNVHICIDNKNSGACNGDSGGPMVCNNQLAGVTSWGMSGCNVTFPSVYTRISNYNDWYASKTGALLAKQIPVPVLY
ncbi:hypothetical protein DPMN_170426 [Dreissena polymorpha]|uniref:Peptidase S1 domain-containing protein n=1 Tax=Dreissena polymorpha TaxID=45954 RepID=A0A9D4DXA8_DREPO|nr:hypothetical protein DPMN_170426 [Dreissena polymorpha]